MKNFSIFLFALAAYTCYESQAFAAAVSRGFNSDAVANCQPALPTFDGNIRKRPMGLANEGSQTVFVTCGSEQQSGDGMQAVGIYVRNRAGASNSVVQCTLVEGLINPGRFLPRTSAPIMVGGFESISWSTSDNFGLNFMSPTLSCALPPGFDIVDTVFSFQEYIPE